MPKTSSTDGVAAPPPSPDNEKSRSRSPPETPPLVIGGWDTAVAVYSVGLPESLALAPLRELSATYGGEALDRLVMSAVAVFVDKPFMVLALEWRAGTETGARILVYRDKVAPTGIGLAIPLTAKHGDSKFFHDKEREILSKLAAAKIRPEEGAFEGTPKGDAPAGTPATPATFTFVLGGT
jgi:hypothetical protein